MKPIWYFVGIILLAMGGIILATGIYLVFNPPVEKTVLFNMHPNIWWGIIMMVFGGIMYFAMRKKTI